MWIKDGAVFTSHADIRRAITNACLPAVITDEVLAPFGFEPVTVEAPPAAAPTEKLEEAEPVKKDGKWVKEYRKRPATPEEIDAATKDKAAEVRATRDALLAASDKTQLADADKKVQGDYVPYRQALRDVPKQAGFPFTVDWPVKP
jgi:hypothetical protein